MAMRETRECERIVEVDAAEDILRALKGEKPRMPVNAVSEVKRG